MCGGLTRWSESISRGLAQCQSTEGSTRSLVLEGAHRPGPPAFWEMSGQMGQEVLQTRMQTSPKVILLSVHFQPLPFLWEGVGALLISESPKSWDGMSLLITVPLSVGAWFQLFSQVSPTHFDLSYSLFPCGFVTFTFPSCLLVGRALREEIKSLCSILYFFR